MKHINISMSFTPNKFLKEDSNIYLRDQQHAARLFVDDQFRLAPKHKFSFHVAFNISSSACHDSSLLQRHKNEINMLVKAVDLPSFTITNEVVNQYNRKKVIQTQHTPGEITITFQDDNMGVINKLWQNYYSYYYADPTSAESGSAYKRNATKNFNFISSSYGLDNGSSNPFFNYITIYQMARHEYVSYKLINPIITSWDHNKLDYSESKTHDFTMKIRCEAIAYGSGFVENGDVEGFGYEHYDVTPSPLVGTSDTGSNSPSFAKSNITNNISVINNIIEQINIAQNTKELPSAGTVGVINNLTIDAPDTVNGLQGIAFPLPSTNNKQIIASSVKLGK
jgi:hypothetical protein